MVQQPAWGDMVSEKSIGLKDRIEQNDGEDVRISWSGYPWNTPQMTPLTPLFSDSGGLLRAAYGAQTAQLLSPGPSEYYSFRG